MQDSFEFTASGSAIPVPLSRTISSRGTNGEATLSSEPFPGEAARRVTSMVREPEFGDSAQRRHASIEFWERTRIRHPTVRKYFECQLSAASDYNSWRKMDRKRAKKHPFQKSMGQYSTSNSSLKVLTSILDGDSNPTSAGWFNIMLMAADAMSTPLLLTNKLLKTCELR